MFDTQKLSFEAFANGYKHGVYVFTQDTCHICHDYKERIKDINSAYLYFVEVTTDEEESKLIEMIDSVGFPVTVGYFNGDIDFVRRGGLYEADISEVVKYLKRFGDKPLPADEIVRRKEKLKTRCEFTYYIFPTTVSEEVRSEWLNKYAIKFCELPIDVSKVGVGLSLDEREHMLEGNYRYVKMVVFDDGETNVLNDDFLQRIFIGYVAVNQDVKFIRRNINDTDNTNSGKK